MKTITSVEKEVMKGDIPEFRVGDTLKISLRVKEGDKTRTQIFEGICVRRRGSGASASFSVLRETHGDIVEKNFPLYSPIIEKIAVSQKGKAHKAKLYHLRKK